jgi:O-antigen/teichoic acid export membrane protein
VTRAGSDALAWLQAWREPVHRDGLALVASTAATGVLGLVFWVVAARLYPPAVVGLNSVAISTMTLLSGLAQLNLSYLLLRFLPVAGTRTRRLVLASYGVSGIASLLVAGLFVLGARIWAPDLLDHVGGTGLLAFLLPGVAVWTVFALQDFVLTALGRAVVVPLENVAFSILKMVLLMAIGGVAALGIAWAWLVATGVTVVVMSGYLLLRVLPRVTTNAEADGPSASTAAVARGTGLGRYAAAEYAGSVAWGAAVFGLPIAVLHVTGPDGAAVYGVAWTIAFALYMAASGTGQSFVAHAARTPDDVDAALRAVVRRALVVVGVPVVVVVAGSSLLLRQFGTLYEQAGGSVLVVAALSALPNVFTNAAVNLARARRRWGPLVAIPGSISVITIALGLFLMPVLGVVGAAIGWLVAQTVVAAVATPWKVLRA